MGTSTIVSYPNPIDCYPYVRAMKSKQYSKETYQKFLECMTRRNTNMGEHHRRDGSPDQSAHEGKT